MNGNKPVNAPLIKEYKQMVIDFVISQMEREGANRTMDFRSKFNEISNRCRTRNVAEFRGIYFVYE